MFPWVLKNNVSVNYVRPRFCANETKFSANLQNLVSLGQLHLQKYWICVPRRVLAFSFFSFSKHFLQICNVRKSHVENLEIVKIANPLQISDLSVVSGVRSVLRNLQSKTSLLKIWKLWNYEVLAIFCKKWGFNIVLTHTLIRYIHYT